MKINVNKILFYYNFFYKLFISILVILLLYSIYKLYLSFEINKNIETFTNNSETITFDLYTKLDKNGEYNKVDKINIVSTTILRKDNDDFTDLNSSSNNYLENIQGKRKVAVKTTNEIGVYVNNDFTKINHLDNDTKNLDNVYLINNSDANDKNNIIMYNGYYKFNIVGKKNSNNEGFTNIMNIMNTNILENKSECENDTTDYNNNIEPFWWRKKKKKKKKKSVFSYNYEIKIPEKKIKNLKTDPNNINNNKDWINYNISGNVSNNSSNNIEFNPNKGEPIEVTLMIENKKLEDVECSLYSSYKNSILKPVKSYSEGNKNYYKFILKDHFVYDIKFDIVPVKGNNFYTLKNDPDYDKNKIFKNLNDSYGQNLYDDNNYLNYDVNTGLLTNQKSDIIGSDDNKAQRLKIMQNGDDYISGLKWVEYSLNYTNSHPSNSDELDKLPNRSKEISSGVVTEVKNFSRHKNYYYVEFNGYFKPNKDGYYRFGVSSDDAGDLTINNKRVAYWYGGHGSYWDKKPGGTSDGCYYLESEKYYKLKARYSERSGGDNMTLLYKFYDNKNSCNTDTSYKNNYNMSVIPNNMLFYKKSDDIPLYGINFIDNIFNNKNVLNEIAENNYEEKISLGDKFNQNYNIDFFDNGTLSTHNYKVNYNYNTNQIIDENICIIQLEFENNQSLNRFTNQLKNIYVGKNLEITNDNISYTKTFSSGDSKYLLYVNETFFLEDDIDSWIKDVLGISYYDQKYYLIKGYKF